MRVIFAAAALTVCAFLSAQPTPSIAQEAPTWLVGEYTAHLNSKFVGAITDVIQIRSVSSGTDGRLAVDAAFRSDRGSSEWAPTQTEATVLSPERVRLIIFVPSVKVAPKFDLEGRPDGSLAGTMTSSTGPGTGIRFEKRN